MDKIDCDKASHDKYVEAETVSEESEISSLSNFTDGTTENFRMGEILIIEPFYGGSHKQLIDILDHHLNKNVLHKKTYLFLMPAKKWHWRARTSALYCYKNIPRNSSFKYLFCSSVLNLAELIALRPDLSNLQKIIYFHENQLVYPIQKEKARDFQYGFNQILSCLVADTIVFNSEYNMHSFLANIDRFLNLQPDFVVKNLGNDIMPKCKVLYYPIYVPELGSKRGDVLHIIWPHRWEHDKNPALFFETLFELKHNKLPFVVSILGEAFSEVPHVFEKAQNILQKEIVQFGRVESRNEYFKLLRSGHVVVSTAIHEFFGVAMLEAVMSGCFPLACNKLVYPELYPTQCLYNTPTQLFKKLKNFCEKPYLVDLYFDKCEINIDKFNVNSIMPGYMELFSKESTHH